MRTRALQLFASILFTCAVSRAQPQIAHFAPHAVVPGAKVTLTFSGHAVAEADTLWASFPAEVQRVTNSNDSFASFELTCPADLDPGVQFVQLVSEKGVSDYQFILVDSIPGGGHKDEHRSLEKAQPIQIPSGVDCILRDEQVDYYTFDAKAGDRIPIEVVAHRIGSQMDPVLCIFDDQHRELAWIDDGSGGTRDSQYVFTVPTNGRYYIAVHDIGYGGGNEYDYRLRIGADPLPGFLFASGTCDSSIRETKSKLPELPGEIAGVLTGSKLQEFSFQAAKDQRLRFGTHTRSIGSPCDLLLRIVNENGSTIAESDPSKPNEAQLIHKFSQDGEYTLQVREITGLPPECRYRLTVEEFRGGFELTTEDHIRQVAPGKSAKLKVTADRQDYKGPIDLSVEGLPQGFAIENRTIPADKNEVELQITAESSATPGKALHFRVAGRAADSGLEFFGPVSTRPALRKSFPLILHFPAELDGLIALGVREE